MAPPFRRLELEGGATREVLEALPTGAGVAQLLGDGDRSLLIARPANLRRWASSQLGLTPRRPGKPGVRPPLDLAPVARAVLYAPATSGFHQLLTYERLMARHVPPAKRKDLRPPGFVHVDLSERFPRVRVRPFPAASGALFGPFRDRASAERAAAEVQKRLHLRPCDVTFEPHPELPLGIACLYAQVRSCAAPCLVRLTEAAYRALAAEACAALATDPGPADGPAAVVEAVGGAFELYPVVDGAVIDDGARRVPAAELAAALAALPVARPAGAPDDWPWLAAWMAAPRATGAFLRLRGDEPAAERAERVQAALAGVAARPRARAGRTANPPAER